MSFVQINPGINQPKKLICGPGLPDIFRDEWVQITDSAQLAQVQALAADLEIALTVSSTPSGPVATADDTPATRQYVLNLVAALTSTVVTNQNLQNLADTTGYAYVIADSAGNIALGIDLAGKVHLFDPVLPAGSIPLAALGSDVSVPQSVNSSMVVWAIVDQLGKMGLWVTPDGSAEFAKLGPTAQAVISAMAAAPPSLMRSTYKPATQQLMSGPDFILWGHSMLAGAGQDSSGPLSGVTVESTLRSKLQAAGSTAIVRNGSVGGETSEGIIGRQGGNPLLLLPSDGTIHADTSASTVTYSVDGGLPDQGWILLQGSGIPGVSAAQGLHGTLAGVPGTLKLVQPTNPGITHNATDYYTFTRDAAGSVATVNRPTPFYTDFATQRRNDIPVFWVGRNNLSDWQRVVADIAAALVYLQPAHKRFLILGDCTGAGETTGTANWTNVTNLNSQLRQTYGRRFIDVRRYLIDYGLQDAGITPTAQDNTDTSGDTVPTSLRFDSVHLKSAGQQIVGNLVYNRAVELGWV